MEARSSSVKFIPIKTFLFLLLTALQVISAPNFDHLFDIIEKQYGQPGVERLHKWQNLLATSKSTSNSDIEQLTSTNNFFNQNIRFVSDEIAWKSNDYWATPIETIGRQLGDCEDFSIAKYITLLQLNFPAEKLRLVYVKALLANGTKQAHMVVAYYPSPSAEPLILDNLNPNILPASKRRDLIPVFSFNSEGLWVGRETDPKIKRAESRLSNWRDVILRMQAEGLYQK